MCQTKPYPCSMCYRNSYNSVLHIDLTNFRDHWSYWVLILILPNDMIQSKTFDGRILEEKMLDYNLFKVFYCHIVTLKWLFYIASLAMYSE